MYAQKVLDESGLLLVSANPVPSGVIGSATWHNSLNAYSSPTPISRCGMIVIQGDNFLL